MTLLPAWVANKMANTNGAYHELLFHGTVEPFEGSLRASFLDSVVWFSDRPAVAQAYCPESGSEVLMSFPNYRRDDPFIPWQDVHGRLLEAMDYRVADMEMERDERGYPSCYRLLENHPTGRDAQAFLEAMGYHFENESAWIKVEMTDDGDKFRPADWRIAGRLFIIERPRSLRLYDMASSQEGGLTGGQWREWDKFEALKHSCEWDGILISDVHQTKSMGHFQHESIGLFDRTLADIRWTSIPCVHHDPGRDDGGYVHTAAFPPPQAKLKAA